jgi:hypothetical protein
MKSSTKLDRSAHSDNFKNNISDMQSRAIQALGGSTDSVGQKAASIGERKRPFDSSPPQDIYTVESTLSTSSSTKGTAYRFFASKSAKRAPAKQMKLCGNVVDPGASKRMNIAIADFIHSKCLPFSLAQDAKFLRVIKVAKALGEYKPPQQDKIAGKYLNTFYDMNWKAQMKNLLSEGNIFGVTVFGNGATIKSVPLLNVLAAGVNNPFALLDIVDCTNHVAKGGLKDASYIADDIAPLIALLEGEVDEHLQKKCTGIIDLVLFDGASSVQKSGELLRVKYPCITVGHGAEHVVSLFFADVYRKMLEFQVMSQFAKKCRNIWGYVRHKPLAMFKKYSREHNNELLSGSLRPLSAGWQESTLHFYDCYASAMFSRLL